jgi:hypothetical protein
MPREGYQSRVPDIYPDLARPGNLGPDEPASREATLRSQCLGVHTADRHSTALEAGLDTLGELYSQRGIVGRWIREVV